MASKKKTTTKAADFAKQTLAISQSTDAKTICTWMRAVRHATGKPQRVVAKGMHGDELLISRTAKLESGVQEPKVTTIAAFMRSLGRRFYLVVE